MSGEAARAADVRAEQEAEERAELVEEIEAELSAAFDNHGQAGTRFVGEHERSLCECGWLDHLGVGLGEHQLHEAALAVLAIVERES